MIERGDALNRGSWFQRNAAHQVFSRSTSILFPVAVMRKAATGFLEVMDLQRIKQTAGDLESELRRTSASVKIRSIEEMEAKLNELADVAGSIAEQLTAAQLDNFDAVRDALDALDSGVAN